MKVTAITATCGRHRCLERLVRMFIDQDYEGEHELLIFNNSEVSLKLNINVDLPSNKSILLINNHLDYTTGLPYSSLGAIYNDVLQWVNRVNSYPDIICFMDDDDLFLPNHISEGVLGLQKIKSVDPKFVAYKPSRSYFRHHNGVELIDNTLEPSIFVEVDHVFKHRFSSTTTEQHLQWVNPLVQEGSIYADPEGTPTLIYNWGDTDFYTFKTSGDYKNPDNFNNYRQRSKDHGDKIITPWSAESIKPYYELINNVQKTY